MRRVGGMTMSAPLCWKFAIQRIDVVYPQIGVDRLALVAAVRPASAALITSATRNWGATAVMRGMINFPRRGSAPALFIRNLSGREALPIRFC